jgi:hypothetical protein
LQAACWLLLCVDLPGSWVLVGLLLAVHCLLVIACVGVHHSANADDIWCMLAAVQAEPVFYLSGLSQLLKSFMGGFVTLELLPDEQVGASCAGYDDALLSCFTISVQMWLALAAVCELLHSHNMLLMDRVASTMSIAASFIENRFEDRFAKQGGVFGRASGSTSEHRYGAGPGELVHNCWCSCSI